MRRGVFGGQASDASRGVAAEQIGELAELGFPRVAGPPDQGDVPAGVWLQHRPALHQGADFRPGRNREAGQQRIAFAGGDHVPKRFQAGGVAGGGRRLGAQGQRLVAQAMAFFQKEQILDRQRIQFYLRQGRKPV